MDTHRHGPNAPLEIGGELGGTAQRHMKKIAASGLEVQLTADCAAAPDEDVEPVETDWLPIYMSRVDGELSCPVETPVLVRFRCQSRTNKGWDAEPN